MATDAAAPAGNLMTPDVDRVDDSTDLEDPEKQRDSNGEARPVTIWTRQAPPKRPGPDRHPRRPRGGMLAAGLVVRRRRSPRWSVGCPYRALPIHLRHNINANCSFRSAGRAR